MAAGYAPMYRERALDDPALAAARQAVQRIEPGALKLIARATKRGYITYDELNSALPQDQMSSEQIEDIMAAINDIKGRAKKVAQELRVMGAIGESVKIVAVGADDHGVVIRAAAIGRPTLDEMKVEIEQFVRQRLLDD